MIMVFTRNRKTMINMLVGGLKIGVHGKDLVGVMAKGAEKDGDEVIAVAYYFHSRPEDTFCDECPVKRFGKCDLKVTVLSFHLFSKFHDGLLDKVRYKVLFNGGKAIEKDEVEVIELKDDGDIVPGGPVASAWENPLKA